MKPLAVTALAFVAGIVLMFSVSGSKGTPSAWIDIDHRSATTQEPVVPGLVFKVTGCGYRADIQITLVDEVTYEDAYYADLSFDPTPHIGTKESVTFHVPLDASGCMVRWWYEGWGIGTHYMRAYQTIHGNRPKLLAINRFETQPHHTGDGDECLYYAPSPNGPYLGAVPENGSLPSNGYVCG
jgi:hypothetical protein